MFITHRFCYGWSKAVGLIALSLLCATASADTLTITEHAVDTTPDHPNWLAIGNDGVSDLVVYALFPIDLVTNAPGPGNIYYRRLNSDGSPQGTAVQVSSDATNEMQGDISGDYIVYGAYDSVDSSSGDVMLYQISQGTTAGNPRSIVRVDDIFSQTKIHGNFVVWRQGAAVTQMQVMIYDLNNSTAGASLTGASVPTFEVEIGDRFVVWSEWDSFLGNSNIVAFDLNTGQRLVLTGTGGSNERQPSTSASWVVWEASGIDSSSFRIEAYDVDARLTDPDAFRSVVDDGGVNWRPRIDGDLITYDKSVERNFDVHLYRLSTRETFAITMDPGEQSAGDPLDKGNLNALVTYIGRPDRNTDGDIFVAGLTFSAPDPCAVMGGDDDGDGICTNDDNCPLVPNPDQHDIDLDAIGDACDPDVDGDGVVNSADVCAGTSIGDVIDPTNGCSIDQLNPCEGPRGTTLTWKNHGKYVSAVSDSANEFLRQGLITEAERDAIKSAAADSECGRR